MSPQHFSGRPPPRLEITVVFGIAATRAYLDGERDFDALNQVGRVKTYKFDTLPEMNAFIQGVDDAVGFLDVYYVED